MRQSRIILTGTVILILVMAFTAADGLSKDPYLKADESWISISGTAVETRDNSFLLDYGQGTVIVEMHEWDWYAKDYRIIEGHRVTVYGEIDNDMFETTTIEASSVYDENRGTYFYASAADKESRGVYDYWIDGKPVVLGETSVRGIVTDVEGRNFNIDTEKRKLTVDTSEMAYNPVDKKGYQTIDRGDYVVVSGDLRGDFWDSRRLMADKVITLYDD